MVENYQERKEAKIQRFQELAEKNEALGNQRLESVRQRRASIPMGQPILVGHYSERGHRNFIDKNNRSEEIGMEMIEKAEYYKKKADNLENGTAISSDDPEAVKKLEDKLKGLEEKREKYKNYNKTARKEGKETLQPYMLQNLSGNIKSVRDRIEYLKKNQNQEAKEIVVNNVRILNNVAENRTQIFFEGIPPEEVRTRLKRNGFRWSPYNKCWQRFLNNWSFNLAQDMVKEAV